MRSGNDKTRVNVDRLGFVGERFGYLLHRTDMLQMQLIREELAGFGLTPARATALAFIRENAGCSQNDLGQALGINRSSAMEVVNALVALAAMERRATADRRTNALFLTPTGHRLFEQFSDISKEVDEVITESLSDSDRATLLDLIGKISDNLKLALNTEAKQFSKPKIYAIS
jgi:DNA-binding MarR family transcriptional regulator